MNVDDIRVLYAYNEWATTRLVDTARALSPAAFARDMRSSHRSVRGTLVHILWAEWIWLRRWWGESPKHVFAEEEYSDVAAVMSRWDVVKRDQRDFIATLTDNHLRARVSYENLLGECWEYMLGHMMQHVVNHSSYHRGQVVTLLRQQGMSPPPTDFLVFLDERGTPAWRL